jgi:hypothetical protein
MNGKIAQSWNVIPENGRISFDCIIKNSVQGRLYFTFGYMDEKRRYLWLADHSLAYLFSVVNIPDQTD